jgi:aminopeptidase N
MRQYYPEITHRRRTLRAPPRRPLLRFLLVAPLFPAAGAAQLPADALAPGVSATLAAHRARTLADVRYDVRLRLPAARTAPVDGMLRVRVRRTADAGPLVLDFAARPEQVRDVRVGPRAVATRLVDEHLVIPDSVLPVGEVDVRIAFIAGDAPLNRRDDYLYTIFVPARAREAMPVFDQPDLKARWSLQLDVPAGWRAVANGAEVARRDSAGRTRLRFAETAPLSTYLFAFAAGKLQVESRTIDGRTFRLFHREPDAAKVARNADAIFALHAKALAWMEDYSGIAYPWGKFDFFAAPAFQFGGMEHAGAIFYNASSLFLDESATQNQLLGRASVIAHETAHLWFGDLVTMRWFDDVWMKEVFANFFAAKIVNPSFPGVNHDLRFLLAHYPAAYGVDRTAGANPIRQPLENLADAGSLYGAIIYQKAPIVMRQLERLVGDSAFRDGMRGYLRDFSFGNATWPDLIERLDARTPADLRAWSRAWVEEPGRPTLTVTRTGDTVSVAQADARGRGLQWTQQLQLVIGDDSTSAQRDVTLDGPATPPVPLRRSGDWVLPTGGGLAYGDVVLDDVSRAWWLAHLADAPDALTRGSALVTLWEEMVGGRIAPAAMTATLLAALSRESDEQLVSRSLAYLDDAYWRWLEPSARAAVARRVEGVLRDGLARASTTSGRGAWFRGLVSVATSDTTLAWLHRVWAMSDSVPGLTLSEDDYGALALQLALREVPGWSAMLDAQERRFASAERRQRFAFVRPAASAAPAERAAWFARLRDASNRRREPWVLDGLALLHHPLRADASSSLVRPALDLLEEITRTGDIFFPKRWLDATLGGHRDPAVAETVRAYLRDHPRLSPRLRAIVEQSADELWRVSAGTTSPPRS